MKKFFLLGLVFFLVIIIFSCEPAGSVGELVGKEGEIQTRETYYGSVKKESTGNNRQTVTERKKKNISVKEKQ